MTNKNIQIFNNDNFGEVRTIVEGNEVLFCGIDIAKALGYKNPREAVRNHCKGAVKFSTPTKGGNQETSFIKEGDVYRLIVKSKLPQAEKFERWVFDEVLPSIRKNSLYVTPKMAESLLNNPDFMIKTLEKLKSEMDKNKKQQEVIKILKPKGEYYDTFVSADGCTGIRDTATQLNINEKVFTNFLISQDLFYRCKSDGNALRPKKRYTPHLFVLKDVMIGDKFKTCRAFITTQGKNYLRQLLLDHGLISQSLNFYHEDIN